MTAQLEVRVQRYGCLLYRATVKEPGAFFFEASAEACTAGRAVRKVQRRYRKAAAIRAADRQWVVQADADDWTTPVDFGGVA